MSAPQFTPSGVVTDEGIKRMLAGEQVLSDAEVERYRNIALTDNWHMNMVGSDIRMILGDLIRARAALAKARGEQVSA